MKVYISGAITGTTDYIERFACAQKQLEAQGWEVINPAAVNALLPESMSYNDYMFMSRTMLLLADAIYMLNDWEHSKGARQEFAWAVQDKTIYFEKDGLPEVHNG